jgi:drug/metabolite transporter (DMT)-like permease
MKRLALSALLLAIVAVWGWTFTLMKGAVASYGVVSFLAVRYVIGTLSIGAFSARRANRDTFRVGGAIGGVLAMAYLFQTLGLRYTTPTNTGLITGLFVVFAPVANRICFGVRTGPLLWAAIGASIVGLALLSGAGSHGVRWGDLLTLVGAAWFGLHIALLDRYAKHYDAAGLALGQLTSATLIFLALWPFVEPIAWPAPDVWIALLVTGMVATAVAFYVQTFVQQRLSAVETALIVLTEPVFAAVFAYWLAGDRLSGLQIVGAAIIFAGMFAAEIVPLVFTGLK